MDEYDAGAATARADLCRFLAACYYQPGPEFAQEKLFDSMFDCAARVDPDMAQRVRRLREHFYSEGVENLLLDYTRLFLGPTNILAQPYGSVWLSAEKTLMQDSTLAVLELYNEGGFEIDESFRELPDHVAAELEFLYLLVFRANEAQQQSDEQRLAALAGLRHRFLCEHLGRWIGPFASAVTNGAQSAFYRELAGLSERVVELAATTPEHS